MKHKMSEYKIRFWIFWKIVFENFSSVQKSVILFVIDFWKILKDLLNHNFFQIFGFSIQKCIISVTVDRYAQKKYHFENRLTVLIIISRHILIIFDPNFNNCLAKFRQFLLLTISNVFKFWNKIWIFFL